jgi:GT2 family glycosyltransferase
MDLSVIVVSFNTKQLLDTCLSSVIETMRGSKLRVEIIVIDNASEDGTKEMLKKKYPRIITVLNKTNVGFGKANNQGIRLASGKCVLLLNSDSVVLDDAIESLYAFIIRHPLSFVGPKILNPDKSVQTSCGPFFTVPVVFAALYLKGDTIGLTRWSPDASCLVDWISGACIMGMRALFLDNLLFDEEVFMYMEEVDLFMRAKQKGYHAFFYPGSRIIHVGSGSSTNKRTGPVLNIYKGLLYVYKKHYSRGALFVLMLMLKVKALVAIVVGYIVGSTYLKQTYEEAYRLV